MALELRNPHSVLAALERRPRAVLEVRLAGAPHGAWRDVVRLSERQGVTVARGVERREGRREPKEGGGRAGSATALVRERDGVSLEELFAGAAERAGGRGVWLALDQIQDPHNVGAIFRTAAFFGIEGIVLLRDRAAPLNATVYDIATGGVEVVPFSLQTNLSHALDQAKQAGVWVLGSSEHAEQSVFEVSRDRPWLLVLGNEEKGMRRLTRERCDVVCSLPPRGGVTSLNVSVAAGVLMAALTAER